MVLKFFETLDSVAEYIEKEENEKGVKYIRRSVAKFFGSESKLTAVCWVVLKSADNVDTANYLWLRRTQLRRCRQRGHQSSLKTGPAGARKNCPMR